MKKQKAMTLLEITVVMVIVSIILALAAPNIGGLRLKGQLRTSARNLATLLRYARGEAIYGHRVVKVRIDVNNRRYWLDLMIDSTPATEREKTLPVEAMRELDENVYFDRVVVYEKAERVRNDTIVLDFRPRGSATASTIVLSDTKGRRMTIEVFGTIGAIEAYSGEPPNWQENPT